MCQHDALDVRVEHVSMTDCNVGALRITANCKECGAQMRLSRGLISGASSMIATADGEAGGVMLPVIAMGEEPSAEWGLRIETNIPDRARG